MNLQLESTRVNSLSLTSSSDVQDGRLDFGVATAFAEQQDINTFLIVFDFEVHLKEGMILTLEYCAKFELEQPITDEFKESKFSKINAPAIAYPFARAFISNFLLNAGYEPILIPSVNFVKLYQESQQN